MRLVADASARPNRCAFIPFVGSSERVGFFDAGAELGGERVYVSFTAFKQMAALAGYSPQGVSASDFDRKQHEDRVNALEAEVGSLRVQLAAVEVLKAGGFQQARKPGRPAKAKETANA